MQCLQQIRRGDGKEGNKRQKRLQRKRGSGESERGKGRGQGTRENAGQGKQERAVLIKGLNQTLKHWLRPLQEFCFPKESASNVCQKNGTAVTPRVNMDEVLTVKSQNTQKTSVL